jgi:predicted enzyme related to lactoylglutathione lyase
MVYFARTDAMLSAIGQISMRAKDLARATAFYRDTLGLRHLYTFGTLAFFDCDGVRLMLGIPEKPEFDHPGSVLYFKVQDLHAVHAELKNRGVTFESAPHLIAKMPDHELWMAFFYDSEANLLALMSEVRQ